MSASVKNVVLSVFCFLLGSAGPSHAESYQPSAYDEDKRTAFETLCRDLASDEQAVVCADIVAMDQTLVYNRFGSFNPYGMMFALNRDVVPLLSAPRKDGSVDLTGGARLTAEDCANDIGIASREWQIPLTEGKVRLRDCKRPRPMVLRANVGDQLLVQVTNLLSQDQAPFHSPDFKKDFCQNGPTDDEGNTRVHQAQSFGGDALFDHGEVTCPLTSSEKEKVPDWPNTRGVNFVAQGLVPLPIKGEPPHPACLGTGSVRPGERFTCLLDVTQEGVNFFASHAAPSGGQGSGGSLVHGLFGSVNVQKPGSQWYRSQVSAAAMDAVWTATGADPFKLRQGDIAYDKMIDGMPVLNMRRPLGEQDRRATEIVHTDLNAIIYCNRDAPGAQCDPRLDAQTDGITLEPSYTAFREFSVFFHDELKTFYTKNFSELGQFGQLAGVRDGFAINYGASGMGAMLLANRKGIGPADDCMECLYEEFFLTSWANGDPALLEWYADDPSNVHHSYMNDPVVFRNFHAGPKETHVFHLHAHQWFAGNDPNRGSYLDSQTVGPQQGFTYNIYHGGLRGPKGAGQGWWASQGSGNRNRTVGDSIFHCHLYPHFAQGMWALWRVHDVLEDGTRLLPDGQAHDGLSVDFTPNAERPMSRPGSVDRVTGKWLGGLGSGGTGTPVPALVPLPGEALPVAPTYAAGHAVAETEKAPMPGYPYYIAGNEGHRPPQAPLDIARDLGKSPGAGDATDPRDGSAPDAFASLDSWLTGGLQRHVIETGTTRKLGISLPDVVADSTKFEALTPQQRVDVMRQVTAKAFALGDLSGSLKETRLRELPPEGTLLERAAMGFHHDGTVFSLDPNAPERRIDVRKPDGNDAMAVTGGFETAIANAPGPVDLRSPVFAVNGAAPRPGAPFADPCGVSEGAGQSDPFTFSWISDPLVPDPWLKGFRRYEASAVQLDMIVNRAGWHDPQARINVLTSDSDRFKKGPGLISPLISDTEEPFFFRALSGECIEFRHTNELPKELELDDFQVKTPTDTIGQHIHLVKFDVTASDGSGNGWNYEDGTFAPD